MAAALDHLVIGAATLEAGLAWARRALGVAPGGGGRHAAMGTHNALWHLARPDGPDAYLEIIAIDPALPPPGRPRWFGLDDPALQAVLAEGPRLLTWQIRPDRPLDAAVCQARAAGVEPGTPLAMTRDDLAWRLTVRDDGTMPEGGRFPVLIEWAEGTRRPPERLAPSGLVLEALSPGLDGPAAEALAAIGAGLAPFGDAGPPFAARLGTPAGPLTLAGGA